MILRGMQDKVPCSQDDGCLAFSLFSFSLFHFFQFYFPFVQNILRSQELRLVQHARWNESRDNKHIDEGGLGMFRFEQSRCT